MWGCRAEMELDLVEGGAWYWGLCEVVFRVPAHFGWAVRGLDIVIVIAVVFVGGCSYCLFVCW